MKNTARLLLFLLLAVIPLLTRAQPVTGLPDRTAYRGKQPAKLYRIAKNL